MLTDTTQMLLANKTGLTIAADLLRRGGLVAFPTETVYGLGADARQQTAVEGIYRAKGRPSNNPLIVHVADIDQAMEIVEFSDAAHDLAKAFWPGPLTLVLPVKADAGLAEAVTAGLTTVAVRVPSNPLSVELLQTFGGPVAAPSANISGKVSPTRAPHVIDGLIGRIDAIVDGGDCAVGLESTIVGFSPEPTLLRPGGLPTEAIEAMLGTTLGINSISTKQPTAPGQLASHYAPNAALRLNAEGPVEGEVMLGFGAINGDMNLSPAGDLHEAAACLFDALRKLDATDAAKIAVAPIPDRGLGRAINDRLARAAAPRDEN